MRLGSLVMVVEPYQILFPMGVAYSFWGALIWVAFRLGWIAYPVASHPALMVNGFLLSFITGFLLTALPKFMGSTGARTWELFVGVLLATSPALAASGLIPDAGAFVGTALQLSFLIFFFAKRFSQGSFSPPPQFIFVFMGLLCGLLGSVLLAGVGFANWGPVAAGGGKALLYQGMVLCPILGVGSRFITALLGWGHSNVVQLGKFKKASSFELGQKGRILLQGILLAVGFVLEFLPGWENIGRALRAVAATWIGFEYWRLHRAPKVRGRLPNWLWIAAWTLIVGLWLYALLPGLAVHALHLVFISGFGLLTLMVASRVILAHGGYGLELEFESRTLRWTGILLLLGAAIRVTATYAGAAYMNHLAYAGFLWVAGLSIWAWTFLPRIFGYSSKE